MPDIPTTAPYADLIAALDTANAQPLWDRYMRVTSRQPRTVAQAMHWPWAQMAPLVERAVNEVSMQDAERRVVLLTHPALKAASTVATTTNLSAGLQTLMPGEHASAHRHTLQAIRFVMEGSGAVTTVNDADCPMEPGDLVLTPAWTWHAHTHHGQERMVWFDGLDLPLASHLDSVFLEMRSPSDLACAQPTSAPALAHHQPQAQALAPDSSEPAHKASSASGARYRYCSQRAQAALAHAKPQADGSRLLRYVNARGGAVLPTLDCYLLGLTAGLGSQSQRSTSNAVCLVVSGHGTSQVGERSFAWQKNDVFTLTHWQWHQHLASSDAVIFQMTDADLMASLGYLRSETR